MEAPRPEAMAVLSRKVQPVLWSCGSRVPLINRSNGAAL
jgi:hypothetical protein